MKIEQAIDAAEREIINCTTGPISYGPYSFARRVVLAIEQALGHGLTPAAGGIAPAERAAEAPESVVKITGERVAGRRFMPASGRRFAAEEIAQPIPHGLRCRCDGCRDALIAEGRLCAHGKAYPIEFCEACAGDRALAATAEMLNPAPPAYGRKAAQEAADRAGEPLLQFFTYEHLPPHLRPHSAPFAALAAELVETLPDNPERAAALRKLLEAKDCAVRARIFKSEGV